MFKTIKTFKTFFFQQILFFLQPCVQGPATATVAATAIPTESFSEHSNTRISESSLHIDYPGTEIPAVTSYASIDVRGLPNDKRDSSEVSEQCPVQSDDNDATDPAIDSDISKTDIPVILEVEDSFEEDILLGFADKSDFRGSMINLPHAYRNLHFPKAVKRANRAISGHSTCGAISKRFLPADSNNRADALQ